MDGQSVTSNGDHWISTNGINMAVSSRSQCRKRKQSQQHLLPGEITALLRKFHGAAGQVHAVDATSRLQCTKGHDAAGLSLQLSQQLPRRCPIPCAHQPGKGRLADEQGRAALVLADLPQRHRARPKAMRPLCRQRKDEGIVRTEQSETKNIPLQDHDAGHKTMATGRGLKASSRHGPRPTPAAFAHSQLLP